MATIESVENLLVEVKYFSLDLDMTIFQANELLTKNLFKIPFLPPITRSDVNLGVYDSRSLATFTDTMNKSPLSSDKRYRLLEMWTKYSENREAMIHEYLLKWNEERILHYELLFFEPKEFSLDRLDSERKRDMKKLEILFQIKFVCAAIEIAEGEKPISYDKLIDGVKSGIHQSQLMEIFVPSIADKTVAEQFAKHVDLVDDFESVDCLLKKNVMVHCNMTIDQVNNW
ncbi:hypothetical protein HDV01_002842 [Terramyces sp. JEL0728]|nr:hypothetical protein HDV01_002842 [Terramyces sp. JEL0728]